MNSSQVPINNIRSYLSFNQHFYTYYASIKEHQCKQRYDRSTTRATQKHGHPSQSAEENRRQIRKVNGQKVLSHMLTKITRDIGEGNVAF